MQEPSINPDGPTKVQIQQLEHADGLELPAYETAGSAGMDLRAACPSAQPIVIKPFERTLVPTGLIFALPEGMEAQIRPRSGLALKHGITCLNSPGTIDWDYRGEVKVILANLGNEPFVIPRGMRIAQIVFAQVSRIELIQHEFVGGTTRGAGGFGSTGL